MIRFDNDYSRSAHPEILKALAEDSGNSYAGYGLDPWCSKAADAIRAAAEAPSAQVEFLVGGTQTNMTVIDIALRSFQGVLCADTGHINVHETGAIENTGHKVIAVPGTDGKITAEQVRLQGEERDHNPTPGHVVEPAMVYLSHPTELGTLYTKKELGDLRAACDRYGFYLFLDGARLNYGLAAPGTDVTLPDIARLCDVFYCGGTKCGTLFGEAVVITNDALKPHFFSYKKQRGALLAKGWLLGLQFYTMFRDGLYFSVAERAIAQAMRIKEAFAAAGIPAFIDSPTNQQFYLLNTEQIEKLSKKYVFSEIETVDETHRCMRFCTSWYTREEDVDELTADIAAL